MTTYPTTQVFRTRALAEASIHAEGFRNDPGGSVWTTPFYAYYCTISNHRSGFVVQRHLVAVEATANKYRPTIRDPNRRVIAWNHTLHRSKEEGEADLVVQGFRRARNLAYFDKPSDELIATVRRVGTVWAQITYTIFKSGVDETTKEPQKALRVREIVPQPVPKRRRAIRII